MLEWLFTIFLLTKENEKRSKKTQSKIENRTHQMKQLEEKTKHAFNPVDDVKRFLNWAKNMLFGCIGQKHVLVHLIFLKWTKKMLQNVIWLYWAKPCFSTLNFLEIDKKDFTTSFLVIWLNWVKSIFE